MISTPLEIISGVLLDLAIGDPRWLPHPVRAIGRLIHAALSFTGVRWQRIAGAILWAAVTGTTAAFTAATLWLLPRPWIHIYWIYSLLAIRDLDMQALLVIRALRNGNIIHAREQLATIVGRDTAHLDEAEITRAAVETVAENLSDGIVAPLFYLALGGPAAMAAYKAVNTLDSMIGYKDERFLHLGWFSARADDWANWIPARLTAALIWIVSILPGLSIRRSVAATLRDGSSQPSPNSGYPEAAVAGALGVRLGGLNHYRGVPSQKAFLGDPVRSLTPAVFPQLRAILYGVSLLSVACLLMGNAL